MLAPPGLTSTLGAYQQVKGLRMSRRRRFGAAPVYRRRRRPHARSGYRHRRCLQPWAQHQRSCLAATDHAASNGLLPYQMGWGQQCRKHCLLVAPPLLSVLHSARGCATGRGRLLHRQLPCDHRERAAPQPVAGARRPSAPQAEGEPTQGGVVEACLATPQQALLRDQP